MSIHTDIHFNKGQVENFCSETKNALKCVFHKFRINVSNYEMQTYS